MIVASVQLGDAKVLSDLRRILGDPEYTPNLATELCNRLLVTCYMGTENSSKETRQRAAALAAQIGWYIFLIYECIKIKAFFLVTIWLLVLIKL